MKQLKPVQFNMQKSKEFNELLKQKVKEYFQTKHISEKGNSSLYIKAIILLVVWLGLYIGILQSTTMWQAVLRYIAFWIVGALIWFNVMHDGGHGGFSSKKWLNNVSGLTMNMLGSSIAFWKVQHNVMHHTYTNIDEYDGDVDSWPVFRFHPQQERRRYHKYQYLYFLPLYWLSNVIWTFYTDFKRYFRRKVGSMPIKKFTLWEHINFRVTKVYTVMFYLVVPAFFIWRLPAIIGLFMMFYGMSIFLNCVFQLAHVMENTEMVTHQDYKVEEHRVIHQLETTTNFAMNNPVWTWLLGGLNYQVEHHLFPQVSHVHYPKISKIVQDLCQQYGIQYNYYPSFSAAFASHVRYLRQMGQA